MRISAILFRCRRLTERSCSKVISGQAISYRLIRVTSADAGIQIAQNCITKDISNNVKLNPNQYGALCSWAFNVGCGNVGSSTLVKDLNAGQNPDTVAEQQLPLWDHGSGDEVLPGLQTRRAAEVKLFTTPTSGQAHPPSCYSRTGRNFARIVMVRKFDA